MGASSWARFQAGVPTGDVAEIADTMGKQNNASLSWGGWAWESPCGGSQTHQMVTGAYGERCSRDRILLKRSARDYGLEEDWKRRNGAFQRRRGCDLLDGTPPALLG